MRIGQLQSLNNIELSLLLYILNVVEPVEAPKFEIGKKELLWLRHDHLLAKLARQESKLTEEGKELYKRVITKLNKTPFEESQEWEEIEKLYEKENLQQLELKYEYPTTEKLTQSDFQF